MCSHKAENKRVRVTEAKARKKMAQRGRPRKRPNTRMDAAIDAMKPFGFSHNVVVETLKELQNVYGEEGWLFIEDASYKVLLEAILEKVNGEETSDSKKPAAKPETLSGILEPACSIVQPPNTALQTSNALDAASETNGALDTEKLTNESKSKDVPSAEAGGSGRKHVQSPSRLSHSTLLSASNLTGQRSHRPYYGWIDTDDEEEDLVVLRPGPLGEAIENWLSSLRQQRERKKRWDVKPEDM